ncbi:PQQ-binding-like beta-propeller repeat protein [Alloacidobacterium sp.]|uniref:outer membrane protein assembly factor BamB family protein n=1 Tax=Alloacidobacterium sp. TaxID=2951999 RepID=UPI002D64EFED|nr:PQQ-binding-like beta-propeller repeat protein [Alloacidobacterium sp.]HYK37120.1 PQQ-binding-like beta-propeller repeat protein [Alloacidobacterium sp.]
MKTAISLLKKKQTAAFRIVGLMLTIAPLWLMLTVANMSVYGQTTDDVPNSSTATTNPSLADWTEFPRDNMQRWNPYETVLGVGNVGNLNLKWKAPNGLLSSSSPVVVNGVVYVGSLDNNVYALDASTGAKLWSYATGNYVDTSPAVANGVVFVSSDDNNLYALNASTGALLWKFLHGSSLGEFSSPAVVNGAVYFGSADGLVYAVKASTGALLWSYTTGGNVFSSPAVVNGVVYVGSGDNNVYALNANTGARLWSYATGNLVFSSPAVANGVVYVGSDDHNMYALNASTGAKLWSFNTGSFVESSPAVTNGIVYFGSGDNNVYALNANTGVKLWNYTAGSPVEYSSPAVANGVVYIGSTDTNIYALNASTGAKLWSYSIGISNTSATVVNGAVYIQAANEPSGKSNVYAFSLGADLFLRVQPSTTTVHQGDLLTYAFPVWNLGPGDAVHEVLNTQVPAGTTFDYIRISGTPGLGTCTHPPFGGTGQIVCNENAAMALNTTWTVRLTAKVTAPAGTVITENAATMSDTPDPNTANNTATVSLTVQ